MSTAELVNQDEAQISRQPSLMAIIDRLSSSTNFDPGKMLALLEMQERWESNQARKAFNVAFSDFKSEAVTIVKNVTVKDGPLKGKKYADLFGVVNVVTPVMSRHGLSHSWKLTKDEPTWMEVTCTIRHTLGHSESVSMGAAPDTGPGRNAIQARGSAKSYLERYTLLAAVGMAAENADDDAAAAGQPEGTRLAPQVIGAALDDIEACRDLVELQRVHKRVCKMAQDSGDKDAELQFIKASQARKAVVRNA